MTPEDIAKTIDQVMEDCTGIAVQPDHGLVGLLQLIFNDIVVENVCGFEDRRNGWWSGWYDVADDFVLLADILQAKP